MPPPETHFSTSAGEHFVAFKIARLGFIPVLSAHGRTIDLIATSADGSRSLGVHVKTALQAERRNADGALTLDFPFSYRAVEQSAPGTLFCFVDLRGRDGLRPPEVFVLPALYLQREYRGLSVRRYATIRHQRAPAELEPFRDNWQPLLEALAPEPAAPARRPAASGAGGWSLLGAEPALFAAS